MRQRKVLCDAISAVTGDRSTVVERVLDGLVAVILDRAASGTPTQIIRLGVFETELWSGRSMFIPNGNGTGSVRVLQDRLKLRLRIAQTAADDLRDRGVPPKFS